MTVVQIGLQFSTLLLRVSCIVYSNGRVLQTAVTRLGFWYILPSQTWLVFVDYKTAANVNANSSLSELTSCTGKERSFGLYVFTEIVDTFDVITSLGSLR